VGWILADNNVHLNTSVKHSGWLYLFLKNLFSSSTFYSKRYNFNWKPINLDFLGNGETGMIGTKI